MYTENTLSDHLVSALFLITSPLKILVVEPLRFSKGDAKVIVSHFLPEDLQMMYKMLQNNLFVYLDMSMVIKRKLPGKVISKVSPLMEYIFIHFMNK